MPNTGIPSPHAVLSDARLGLINPVWFRFFQDQATTVAGSALTRTNDTNVTLTLGGSPLTALLAATSITAGWAGTLSVARGGTASNTAAGARTALGVPATDGTGASGTWGIGISGNAATATLATNASGLTGAPNITVGTVAATTVTATSGVNPNASGTTTFTQYVEGTNATATVTGFTTAQTASLHWVALGKMVILTCSSNTSATATNPITTISIITGLPAALRPSVNTGGCLISTQDNGAAFTSSMGVLNTAGTLTIYNTAGALNFTNAGTPTGFQGFVFPYVLN